MNTVSALETKLHIMKQVQYFCNHATANDKHDHKYEIVGGTKYIKVAMGYKSFHGGKSVHFFVNATNGDVHKPAGWNAPSKTIKYNISDADGLVELIRNWNDQNMGFCGSYLYSNWEKVPATY